MQRGIAQCTLWVHGWSRLIGSSRCRQRESMRSGFNAVSVQRGELLSMLENLIEIAGEALNLIFRQIDSGQRSGALNILTTDSFHPFRLAEQRASPAG